MVLSRQWVTLESNNWNNLFINNFESFRDTKIILKRQARLHCKKSIKFLRLLAIRDDTERIIIFFLFFNEISFFSQIWSWAVQPWCCQEASGHCLLTFWIGTAQMSRYFFNIVANRRATFLKWNYNRHHQLQAATLQWLSTNKQE